MSNIRKAMSKMIQRTFESNSNWLLSKKLRTFEKSSIFDDEDMSKHFAHLEINKALQNVVKGFIIDRINFICATLNREELKYDTFCDMGDSDGIFLKALGKDHLSINRSKIAIKNIRGKGIDGIICDIDMLPLKSNSIDHILLFETFEHLPNPIKTLQELHRICNKSIFITIPYLSKTNILKYGYGPSSWPIFEHHIFEFDDRDFRKIISHSKFKVDKFEVAEVLNNGENMVEIFVFLMWRFFKLFSEDEYRDNQKDLFYGCFKKFSMYHLVKEQC